ncbi:hypothetical protein BH23ACT7_BH23ACT7_09080 [soil metagenome]
MRTQTATPPPSEMLPLDFSQAAAEQFLIAQLAGLAHGLARAEDAGTVAVVLAIHECSHEAWLRLIAGAGRHVGRAASEQVAAVYSMHGRIAGSLERGIDARLDPTVARTVRRLLSDWLRRETDKAVASLSR